MKTDIALFVLADEYLAATQKLADLDLDPQTVADTLEGLQFPIEQKGTQVAAFVQNLEATAKAIDEAVDAMTLRRDRIRQRAATIREYLKGQMERTGITKIDSPWFRIAVRQNPPSVVIDDEDKLPAKWKVQPPAPPMRPDKARIKDDLEHGVDVPECRLERKTRLEIK
jgi:hypothetical protein